MNNQSENEGIVKRLASKGVFPYQMAFTLLIPVRNIFLSPKKLIQRLELEPNQTVLEVGPGPGYFSTKVARVLTQGKLILADIQQEMLDYAKKRLDRRGIKNVSYRLCNGQNLDFQDNYFDRIYMVTVIGEIENKEAYIKEFERVMKPGGILSISELAGDPDKLTINEVKLLMQNSGFAFYKLHGNERNYTLNFRKK